MTPRPPPTGSVFAPFRHRAFALLWTATVISNIGTWMYNVASGWLMLRLDPDPFLVSMVQVANGLPMFLFAIPGGALIDMVDKRRFLIAGESAITIASAVFATLVWRDLIGPGSLLALSFLVAAGSALTAPAWQAIVSKLVPKADLAAAVAANSVGINVSRAVGPALGGVIVATAGLAAPFWLDAISNLGVIAALIRWKPPAEDALRLPAESFGSAVRTGLRHARYNPYLGATLIRATAYFAFASAYWALLPLVASRQLAGGPALYGLLLGAIGVSAVAGAIFLRRLRVLLGADRLVAAATLATSLATALFAVARNPATAIAASLVAGAAWIAAVSNLNVSAQVALPDWVRGRGLAMYVTVMFGALTLGSAVWGEVAALTSVPAALLVAAAGGLAGIAFTRGWKLQTGADLDFSPSQHWPEPVTLRTVDPDRGPVLVTIEYHIDPKNREAFLLALSKYARERRRDGAYDSGIFEDPAVDGRFVETFLVDSWLDHLRQHQRVTKADAVLQKAVLAFQVGDGPTTTHLVGAHLRS